jgi:hypothetical protein
MKAEIRHNLVGVWVSARHWCGRVISFAKIPGVQAVGLSVATEADEHKLSAIRLVLDGISPPIGSDTHIDVVKAPANVVYRIWIDAVAGARLLKTVAVALECFEIVDLVVEGLYRGPEPESSTADCGTRD